MLCGSFAPEEDDPRGPSTPRRCRGVQRSNNNPYSSRGLDKFALLSADLEARRRNIITKTGCPDSSLVRFVHSSHGLIPVVVKVKDGKQELGRKNKAISKKPTVGASSPAEFTVVQNKSQPADSSSNRTVKKAFSWSAKKDSPILFKWRKPDRYGPLILVFMLLCLVFSGRVFAIICTSIWWYLVPIITGGSQNKSYNMKKKDYGRRLSDKRITRSATATI